MSLKKLQIKIELLSPAVLTSSKGETVLTEAGNSISGTTIRGLFANRYLTVNPLMGSKEVDDVFADMMFNNLRFVDAMPLCGTERAIFVPRSLMKGKAGTSDGDKIQDLSKDSEHRTGYKGCKGMAIISDGMMCAVQVDKNISMHINRCDDEKRIAGKTTEGGIFNYEALSAGQFFQGEIIGNEADLKKLLSSTGLKQGQSIEQQIGRSRNTQYGRCRMTIGSIENIEDVTEVSDKLVIRLETPFIPTDVMAYDCKKALSEIAKEIGNGISIGTVWGSIDTVDNFVGVWGMRRPRVSVVAAGTVFILEKAGQWTDDEVGKLNNIMYSGAGMRTAEGFGQLRIWDEKDLKAGNDVACRNTNPVSINKNGSVANIAQRIARRYILSKMRQFAYDEVQNMKGLKGKAHFFTRLDSLLGDKTHLDSNGSFRDYFSKAIAGELNNVTNFETYLREIHIGDRNLLELLRDKHSIPYAGRWQQEVNNSKTRLGELMDEIGMSRQCDISDGEYFYEYWHWLFRYARKQSAGKNKGGEA